MFPSDAQFADWMQWFCADPESSNGEKLPYIFRLPGGMRCATDAKYCVVAPGEAPEHHDQKYSKIVSGFLNKPILHSVVVDAAALRAEVGERAGKTGELCRMVFFGKEFDRERIQYILAHTPPAERYQVSLSGCEPLFLLNIAADGWRAMLVDLREGASCEQPKPT